MSGLLPGESYYPTVAHESLASRIMALPPVEVAIIDSILTRLELGLKDYGPWDLRDGRDYQREAQEEVTDALIYVAARLERDRQKRPPKKRDERFLTL